MAKIKEDAKIRREKEKKKFATIINKYDKTLNWKIKEQRKYIIIFLKYKIDYYLLNKKKTYFIFDKFIF